MESGAELLAAYNCCGYTMAQQCADLASVLGALLQGRWFAAFLWQEDALKPLALEVLRCENHHQCWLQDEGDPIQRKSAHLRTQAVAPNKLWCRLLNKERRVVRRCWHFQKITFPVLRALLMPGSSLDYLVANRSVQLTLWPLHQWGH